MRGGYNIYTTVDDLEPEAYGFGEEFTIRLTEAPEEEKLEEELAVSDLLVSLLTLGLAWSCILH